VLLWWLADDPRLSAGVRVAIGNGETRVAVSAASAWEISIKRAIGKLVAPDDLRATVVENRLEELPISFEHAAAAGRLPRHHDDPFDRMLVAQARSEGLVLVSGDAVMSLYEVEVLAP